MSIKEGQFEFPHPVEKDKGTLLDEDYITARTLGVFLLCVHSSKLLCYYLL